MFHKASGKVFACYEICGLCFVVVVAVVLESIILLNKEVLPWVSSFLKNVIMYSLQEVMGLIMTFLFMYNT